MEERFLGVSSGKNVDVKEEDVEMQEQGSEAVEDELDEGGPEKKSRKRIHKCDRDGCSYSTDHVGHYR